ncbi:MULTISPECIES: helix-turn-helix domain-containing protein [unclassified Bradyrhizobium]|uniref:helix-turn-helix domain-containing protein n=1 Tax=unclassified Bradyrhizobium TaxID=2631580 RepID=UPI00211F12C5|nr:MULTISPECIES: helix-turn-helix transcriptional regulator [unclassified Bradyrhizobium]MDD1537407.1 XRE family transcriptional regulator [Bradyrhizobium sp. WBOS8]MDD1586934.1 XRE family transcriptional regulator [Bradyrhizobium sp. WBOS4]UUO47002.1 XRE family transcriptional regulator [Bradyrhizobium sp. WBOS04]UUO60619.1 XRE family transcriptional regulator [Bradyrhizobium sp. WBOS08]
MKKPGSAPPRELTPAQARAARALLAWSQQDLATNANIATSTVADFERGRRTPVPQNAEAMRAAFERAGISFPAGGAVKGPPLPQLADVTKTGAPIQYVNGTDLAQWAERRDGQASMPSLLAKLIRASGNASLHFPSDEAIQMAGWDGITQATVASEYVPAGSTGWEIGTQRKDIAGKADGDYAKRTGDPLALTQSDTTFVFVTPRPWPKKDEWAKQKRAEGVWKDVKAYDGTDLLHWIELYPSVGQWLATALGKRPPGVRQLEEVWLEWSLATQWPLPPDLVLSDRDEDSAALLRWLRAKHSAIAIQSESSEEVAAFVYATIHQLPPDIAEHYSARCVVAANSDAARQLAGSRSRLIIVILEPETGVAETVAANGHHVLAAFGQTPGVQGTIRKLERPSREGIETALMTIGVPEDRAKAFARDSARSLAILRRLMPAAAIRLPQWAQGTISRALLAALLAGMWDESRASDKEIMARLSEMSYDAFIASIAPFAGEFDTPLRKVGSAWKIASPRDAWFLLASHFTVADIERYRSAAIDVLSAADPRYTMNPEDRWNASVLGIEPEYSRYLRHGLGDTLILLALFGDRATMVPKAEHYPDAVVRKVLRGADSQRWWSLSRDFQLLAEASPDEFLSALDDSLDNENPPIAELFKPDENPIFGSSEHLSDLLWALESLAWAPQHLPHVSLVLARLDELDRGGRYANRPAASLRTAFLLWSPQTNATYSQRLKVLDRIRKRYPNPAWKLMLGILPTGHDSFSPTPLPRWRDFSTDKKEVVTYQLIGKGAEAVLDRLLEDVGSNAERWVTLLDRWSDLGDKREKASEQLELVVQGNLTREDREMLRDKLRSVLNHQRSFKDADWALPANDTAQLQAIYDALAPLDPIERIAWLFETSVSLPDPTGDWEEDRRLLQSERSSAAQTFLESNGVDALFDLVGTVREPGYLGQAIAESNLPENIRKELLVRALRSERKTDQDFARGIVWAWHFAAGREWVEALFDEALRNTWGEDALLTILLALPSAGWVWQLAKRAGETVEERYWKKLPLQWNREDDSDPAYAVEKFIEAGRARTSVHLIGLHLHGGRNFKSDLLARALTESVRQPFDSQPHSNDQTMFQHYAQEIFKQLDKADDISPKQLAQLEWQYLPMFEHSERKATAIMTELASNPDLFVQLICAVFKPSEDSGVVDPPVENEEQARLIASQAYRLLRLWNVIPGTSPDGSIDGSTLETWITEARRLAQERGRSVVADQKIGELLSASTVDADGIWPAEPIREVIEAISSPHLETGVEIGKMNRRGVTMRPSGAGGDLERQEVKKYRDWAKAAAFDWPRTSGILESLAKNYERQAKAHDDDAERQNWR